MSMSLVMKSVQTSGVDTVEVVEIPRPAPGPRDAVVRIRACGICDTDLTFLHRGGLPERGRPGGPVRPMPLGHEPVGEVVDYGSEVRGLKVGDRVVINPRSAPTGVIGCGGELGGMTEFLLVEDAVVGASIAVFPETVPFEVAALTETMAVARHCVDRAEAAPADRVVVFGAGPIGLGATIWLKLRGAGHVVVADAIPERLAKALAVGADAVIDTATEDVTARLTELHGQSSNAAGQPCPATDVYIDAAGTAAAFDAARAEGCPADLFEVTLELAAHHERFAKIISHRVPYAEVEKAFELASTPRAADKVVVTLP